MNFIIKITKKKLILQTITEEGLEKIFEKMSIKTNKTLLGINISTS